MFSVHTTPEKFKNEQSLYGHFGFVFEENSGRKIIGLSSNVIVFEKLRFRKNVFCLQENENPAFSNSPGLKSVFEKIRFRDGLVWTVGLTVEIKLLSSGVVWTRPQKNRRNTLRVQIKSLLSTPLQALSIKTNLESF